MKQMIYYEPQKKYDMITHTNFNDHNADNMKCALERRPIRQKSKL